MQITNGITRTVLLTKNYAIKFPRLRSHGEGFRGLLWQICRGILANQSELEWSNYSDELCPVLYSMAGIINVYPRVRVATSEEFCKNYKKMKFKTPSDKKSSNFGWYKNKFVWIDYDMGWNDTQPCKH